MCHQGPGAAAQTAGVVYPHALRQRRVQLIEYTTGGLQVVETSRMINGNRMHLSSISSLIAKGLNTYVHKEFQNNMWSICTKKYKPVFALSLWGIIVFRLMRTLT